MTHPRFCNTVEAKTNLNQYLDDVEKGQVVVIRRRGKAVAKMVPVAEESLDDTEQISHFIGKLKKFHARVRRAHGPKSHTVSILREIRRES